LIKLGLTPWFDRDKYPARTQTTTEGRVLQKFKSRVHYNAVLAKI